MLPLATLSGNFGAEARRTLGYPVQESRETRMVSQGPDCVEFTGQFHFRQACVDFTMADVVQKDCRPTLSTFEFGD